MMMPYISGLTPYARFYSKVALPDENGCMLWLGHRNKYGYGVFSFRGVMTGASRVSLLFAEGAPTTDARHAAHSCRNKHCVAPAHLRWATVKDNASDRIADGTECIGEKHGHARLTEADVVELRTLYAAGGLTYPQLAARYGVSPVTIGQAVTGKTWRHIPVGGQ